MEEAIRIDFKVKSRIPVSLLEELLSIHPAIDVESGHITCHYESFSLLVAHTSQGPVPLIAVNDCILLTVGEGNVGRLVAIAGPESGEVTVKPGGVIRVGLTEVENPDVVELLLSDTRLELRFHEVRVEGIGGSILVVARPSEGGDPLALIVVPCKPKGEWRREALHY